MCVMLCGSSPHTKTHPFTSKLQYILCSRSIHSAKPVDMAVLYIFNSSPHGDFQDSRVVICSLIYGKYQLISSTILFIINWLQLPCFLTSMHILRRDTRIRMLIWCYAKWKLLKIKKIVIVNGTNGYSLEIHFPCVIT